MSDFHDQRNFPINKLRDILQYYGRTATAESLSRVIEIFGEQLALEQSLTNPDVGKMAFLRSHIDDLKRRRNRLWSAEWQRREIDQLEADCGAAFDALPEHERRQIIAEACAEKKLSAWTVQAAAICPLLIRATALRVFSRKSGNPANCHAAGSPSISKVTG